MPIASFEEGGSVFKYVRIYDDGFDFGFGNAFYSSGLRLEMIW